jgi:hypothetical protein
MSLAKSVPGKLNPRECEHTKLLEPPPVPFIPEKDKVQEEAANFKTFKSRLLWRRIQPSTFWCGAKMRPKKLFSCM